MILKQLRVKKKLTQNELATQLGIGIRYYQKIEAGHAFPRKEVSHKLEDMFELPQRVLLAKSVEEVPDYLKKYTSIL